MKELEAEVSQMTNRILVLQNENNDLKSVEVASNVDVLPTEPARTEEEVAPVPKQ